MPIENWFRQVVLNFEDVSIISRNTSNYGDGITILPLYYSKVLEFDLAIIVYYDNYSYSILDKKLL